MGLSGDGDRVAEALGHIDHDGLADASSQGLGSEESAEGGAHAASERFAPLGVDDAVAGVALNDLDHGGRLRGHAPILHRHARHGYRDRL